MGIIYESATVTLSWRGARLDTPLHVETGMCLICEDLIEWGIPAGAGQGQ